MLMAGNTYLLGKTPRLQAIKANAFGDLAQSIEGGVGRLQPARSTLQMRLGKVGIQNAVRGPQDLGDPETAFNVIPGGFQAVQVIAGQGQGRLDEDGDILRQ
ncbi:hypothetical protein D9M73_197940 [compost metagenome]